MQAQVLVACNAGPSLREKIGADRTIEKHGLTVTQQRKVGRKNGWTKVYAHPYNAYGAVNLHWDPHSALLICRVVTRKGNKPGPLVGRFVGYLLTKYRAQIQSITVVP